MKFRGDIEGLRAVAIVPVVLYHAAHALAPGGFVGVDVFFVISGFLITGIIAGELQQGTFTLASFYQRRIRRIFPALFFMLAGACILAFALLPPHAMVEFGRTVVATVLFLSNVQFMKLAGYFEGSGDLKPLLHTWSLAVEEQFYIFFPLMLLIVHRWLRLRFVTVLLPLAVLALAKALWSFHKAPTAAFYLSPNRAIELLIGALVAVAALPALRSRLGRELATGCGLALIACSVVLYNDFTPFPGWHALVPCVGAALIIYGGRDGVSTVRNLLSLRPVRYIGFISYALYLWHWPLLVFARHYTLGNMSGPTIAAAVAAAILLAAFSGRFIERPFRIRGKTSNNRQLFAGAAACVAAFGTLGLVAVADAGVPQRFSPAELNMFSYSKHYNPRRTECHSERDLEIAYADDCVYGAAGVAPSVAVWGDSYGAELVVGLGEMAKARDESVLQVTSSACPPSVNYSTDYRPHCAAHNKAALSHLRDDSRIRAVILVAKYEEYYEENWPALMAGLEAAVTELERAGKQVTVMYPLPTFPYPVPDALGEMIVRGRSPGAYTLARSDYLHVNALSISSLDAMASHHGVQRIYPAELLCDATRCRAFDGHAPMYWDAIHVSVEGAEDISPAFAKVLVRAGPSAPR